MYSSILFPAGTCDWGEINVWEGLYYQLQSQGRTAWPRGQRLGLVINMFRTNSPWGKVIRAL